MDDYRLYRVDGTGQIQLVELLKAGDDDDAVQQARKLGRDGLKCEVWQGRRLVTTLQSQDLTQCS